MTEMLAEWERTVDATTTAFFLDVDGTLLGFEDQPEDVRADPELLDLLARLRAAAGGALALVSGRMISDLDRIVAPLVLPAGGTHGAELRFADGRREDLQGDAMADLRSGVTAFVATRPGLRIEDKGSTIAVHYRHAPDHAAAIGAFLDAAVVGSDLMVQHGKLVAEVRPTRSHKGAAIETLMGTAPFLGRTPLFIGDDLTDEHGFESVNRLGGISVRVGFEYEATIADRRLANVGSVRSFLAETCRL